MPAMPVANALLHYHMLQARHVIATHATITNTYMLPACLLLIPDTALLRPGPARIQRD
jgi:hypothetical protein